MIDLHVTAAELDAGLDHIRQSPKDSGVLLLIVRRPAVDRREVVDEGEIQLDVGLVGDTWPTRPSSRTPDGSPHPERQITIMNSRAVDLISGGAHRWPLAGDQLYVDLDLSLDNLPPGTQLRIGDAILEVTDSPHTGCAKFSARFGSDAIRFVNSREGRHLNLRGIYARVVRSGRIVTGDTVHRFAPINTDSDL